MYILQVKYKRSWKWGINTYNTIEEANNRVEELAKAGIKSRVRLASELYGR